MRKDHETNQKDVIIEGVRFTPEMLTDVHIDKEKLLNESYSDIRGAKITSNHEKPIVHKIFTILARIVGLGFLTLLFFSVDLLVTKVIFGIAFIALLATSIHDLVKKDSQHKFSFNLSEQDLLKYGGYTLVIALSLLAVYFLIDIISKYIIWIILFFIFITWLMDN